MGESAPGVRKVELAYRPLASSDLAALKSLLTRAVANDYILPMAGEWISTGTVLGGWDGARLVAMMRLTDLGSGEGWLGGVRVDPDYRRRGVGLEFMRYTCDLAAASGFQAIRLLIEESNTASNRLAVSSGCRVMTTLAHSAGRPQVSGGAVEPAKVPMEGVAGLPKSLRWVEKMCGMMSPTLPEPFCIAKASPDRLAAESSAKRLYNSGRGLFALAPPVDVTWADSPLRACAPIDGPLDEILAGCAGLMGSEQSLLDIFLPVDKETQVVAESFGLKRGAIWGHSIHLYEKRLS